MKLIIRIVIRTVAIMIGAYFIPGVGVENWVAALIFAVVLAVINAIVKPILVILTLPINILTLGLFTLVINTVLILFATSFVPGITIAGFVAAFLFGIVLAIVEAILHMLTPGDK